MCFTQIVTNKIWKREKFIAVHEKKSFRMLWTTTVSNGMFIALFIVIIPPFDVE